MTEARTIFVYDPTATANVPEHEMAERVGDLNGKVIGLLDNSKPNFDIFLDRVQEQLSKRYKVAGFIRKRKSTHSESPGRGAAESTIEELVSKADVVINGMGD
ncbi:MAG: hypothetical protein HYX92_16060 [Chloroflexi bacterium]|nr:hypothetical protein [Chloroflexota bacterium]